MSYFAKSCAKKIDKFLYDIEFIDIETADRNGRAYFPALAELGKLERGWTTLEEVFRNPDNPLRNMCMLTFLDVQTYANKPYVEHYMEN